MVWPQPLSSSRGRRSALRRRTDGNVAAVSHGQHVPTPIAAAAWRANTAVSKVAWWSWPFDFESGVRVTCDVGYLCANFVLPRPLCSRFRSDVRDRQTDVRQKHRLIPRLLGAGIINNSGDLKSKIVITKDLEYDRTYADYGYIYYAGRRNTVEY